jgi:hypothetical protein
MSVRMIQCSYSTHDMIKNILFLYVSHPVVLVSNPHPVGLASLHRGEGGSSGSWNTLSRKYSLPCKRNLLKYCLLLNTSRFLPCILSLPDWVLGRNFVTYVIKGIVSPDKICLEVGPGRGMWRWTFTILYDYLCVLSLKVHKQYTFKS